MLGEGVDMECDASWVWAEGFQRYTAHAHLLPQATGVAAVMKGAPASPHLSACPRHYGGGGRGRVLAPALVRPSLFATPLHYRGGCVPSFWYSPTPRWPVQDQILGPAPFGHRLGRGFRSHSPCPNPCFWPLGTQALQSPPFRLQCPAEWTI